MDEQNTAYAAGRILFNHEKEWNCHMFYGMDELENIVTSEISHT